MIELIRSRRSIRTYQKEKIGQDHQNILKEALLRAPTSKDNQAWEFIFVDDKILLHKLSECKPHGASFLKQAPLCIVICGDEKLSDVWVENGSIAATFVQLVAHSLGIGSCWIQIRNRNHSENETAEEYIQRLLQIPKHLRVVSVITLGYPAEEKEPVPYEDLKLNKIHFNQFIHD